MKAVLEKNGFLPAVPESGLCPSRETELWYALSTRSRHEKLAYEELNRRGIYAFLPLRRITRRWSDRMRIIEEPLFRGYLFVHASLSDRWEILGARGIVRFVGPSAARPFSIPEKEINAVRLFIENDLSVDPYPYLKEGERVYVRSGPCRGVEGFIIRKGHHSRLIVSVDLLSRSVSVEVDAANVEKL